MSEKLEFFAYPEGDSYLFAIEIVQIALTSALSERGDNYGPGLMRRQANWLNCLMGTGDGNKIFDLRIVSEPDRSSHLDAKVRIALLCRTTGTYAESVAFARELLRVCQTYFEDEYEFAPVVRKADLLYFLVPFTITDCVRLTRRSAVTTLDSLAPLNPRKMGFGADIDPVATSEDQIFHVYPFVPSETQPAHVLKLLLYQESPLAISMRLVPTQLTQDEADLMVEEIARCENYMHSPPRPNHSSDPYYLRSQTEVLYTHLVRSLGLLTDSAALLIFEIASGSRVPQSLVDMFGSYITGNPGNRADANNTSAFLAGGYSPRRIDEHNLGAAARN